MKEWRREIRTLLEEDQESQLEYLMQGICVVIDFLKEEKKVKTENEDLKRKLETERKEKK